MMVNVSQDKNRIIAEALHQAICELRDKGITYSDMVQFNFYCGWSRFVAASYHSKRTLLPIEEEREGNPWFRCWFR
jgi:hypothetical protein